MSTCILHQALGRTAECPGEDCTLWQEECTLRGIRADLVDGKELAAHLLELRERLEELRPDA